MCKSLQHSIVFQVLAIQNVRWSHLAINTSLQTEFLHY